jgi:hypothetical protein
MVATYQLKTDEITENFFRSIRENYRNKEIEITIREVEDATDYLLKSEANRQHLLHGIDEIQSGAPLRTMTVEQLNELV